MTILEQLIAWRTAGLIKIKSRADGTMLIKIVPQVSFGHADRTLDIRAVFGHWQSVHKHPQAILDNKRRDLVKRMLLKYTATQLCTCIDGYARSPHHMGQNATGTRYDDIGLMLRDAAHVEAGIEFSKGPRPALVRSREDPQANLDPDLSHERWLRQMRELTGNPHWTPAPAQAAGEVITRGPIAQLTEGFKVNKA